MKVLSLFSGVGGFDLGLERAGMRTVFQCELDPHANKVLEQHWPDVPRWGDISTLTGAHVLQHAPVIDVVAWGSPCQDLSLAGKRAGLVGNKSALFYEGIRIIREIRETTNGQYPRISIWENVVGALSSSDGADFGQVLYEMDEAGACFSEWRILDAQYFGIPQRRRRVFLISVFDPATAARCPDPLLPVSESVSGHIEAGATTGQNASKSFAKGVGRNRAIIGSEIVGSLAASDWKFPQQQQVHENKIVLQPIVESKSRETVIQYDGYNQRIYENDVGITVRIGRDSSDFIAQTTEPTNMAVRRLTPIECERLMGWPDDWTANQADTNRYKQCGNGVASPVAQWIGGQLMRVLDNGTTTD